MTLGEKHDWIGSGSRRHYGIVKDEMMYIPLLKTNRVPPSKRFYC